MIIEKINVTKAKQRKENEQENELKEVGYIPMKVFIITWQMVIGLSSPIEKKRFPSLPQKNKHIERYLKKNGKSQNNRGFKIIQ